jgi:hypothetical protein
MLNKQNFEAHPGGFTHLSGTRGKWMLLIACAALFLVVAAALLPETLLHAASAHQSVAIKPARHPAPPAFSASPVTITFSALVDQKNFPSQIVTLKNNSKKILYWRTSLTALDSGVIGAAPAGGVIVPGKTAQVRVMVNKSKLNIGAYTFRFDLFGLDAKNKPVTGSPLAIKVTVLIRVMHVQPQQK